MAGAAGQNKKMKDLMKAEVWQVNERRFDPVNNSSNSIEKSAGKQPDKTSRGQGLAQRDEGYQSQPAHKDIDAGRQPAGGGKIKKRQSDSTLPRPLPDNRPVLQFLTGNQQMEYTSGIST